MITFILSSHHPDSKDSTGAMTWEIPRVPCHTENLLDSSDVSIHMGISESGATPKFIIQLLDCDFPWNKRGTTMTMETPISQ